MKFKSLNNLNEDQKSKLRRLIGVRHKQPMVLAQLQKESTWNVLVSPNKGPINADKKLKRIATFSSIQEVLAYFHREELQAYCLDADIDLEKEENPVNTENVLHRRGQYRKNVTLEGHLIHPGTQKQKPIIINDLSFNGAGFFTADDHLLQPGDILEIAFRLTNRNQSLIKRKLEVKHVSDRKIGGAFVNKPRLDANLGFFLMFNER